MCSSINIYTLIPQWLSNACLILSVASRLLLVLNMGCECKDPNISTNRLVLESNLKKSKALNTKRSLANHTNLHKPTASTSDADPKASTTYIDEEEQAIWESRKQKILISDSLYGGICAAKATPSGDLKDPATAILKLEKLRKAKMKVEELIAIEKKEQKEIVAKTTEEISIEGYMTSTLALEREIDEILKRIEERDKRKILKRIEERLALKLKEKMEVEDLDRILQLEEEIKEILKPEGTIQAIRMEVSATAKEVNNIIQKVIKETKEDVVRTVMGTVQERINTINKIIQLCSDKTNIIHEINHAVKEAVDLVECDIEESLSEDVRKVVAELKEMESKVVKTISESKAKVQMLESSAEGRCLLVFESVRSKNFLKLITASSEAGTIEAKAINALKTAEALRREQVEMRVVIMLTNVIASISIWNKEALQNCEIAVKEIKEKINVPKAAKIREVQELINKEMNKEMSIESQFIETFSLEKENIIKKAKELENLLSIVELNFGSVQ